MANNNEDPKPVRKTWIMLKKAPVIAKNLFITKDNKKFMTSDGHEFLVKEDKEEPVTPPTPPAPIKSYVTEGLVAHFSGEDNYIDGAWVDRINGYKLTPASTSAVPVYDTENKLYNVSTTGGMVSDLTTGGVAECSIEIVTRDVKDVVRPSNTYGTILGGTMKDHSIDNGLVIVKNKSEQISLQSYVSQVCTYHAINNSEFEDNGLDTLTIVPHVGFFRNGVKVADCNAIPGSSLMGLFTHIGSNASSYRGKGKVHAVRYYNRQLTEDEIVNNYNIDKDIYNG
jgi:hypothetical protein